MPLVYCSGLIAGRSYDQATLWYDFVRSQIRRNIELLLPMRGKDHMVDTPIMPSTGAEEDVDNWHGVIATDAAITGRDRDDVHRCDLVLMNLLGAPKVSIGCMMEAGWADAYRKPIVLACEKGNPHYGHPILRGVSTYKVGDLSVACDVINHFFRRA